MQIQPSLATSLRGDVADQGALQAAAEREVPRRHAVQRRGGEVHVRPRAASGNPPARWASLAGPLAGAEVVDDLTVDIVTKEPYGPILRTLAMYCTGIVSPTAVQKMGEDFSRAPVGTGPFKFVEWKTNTHVIIERNPDYWGDKALLDRVIFKVVPEEGARMIALQTGDADMVLFPSPAQLPALRKDPKFTVHEATGLRVVFAGLQREHAAARRRARAPGAAPRGRPQGDPRQHHGGLGGARARRAGARRVRLQGHAARPALSRSTAPRPRRCSPRPAGRPGPDGILQKGGQKLSLSWLAARGRYPKDGEITEADPGHVQGGRRRGQGAVPRVGRGVHSSSAPARSTTTCSRSAG